MLMDSCPHFCFDTFLSVHTKMFGNNKNCTLQHKLNSGHLLYTHLFCFCLIQFREHYFQIDEFSIAFSVLLWREGQNVCISNKLKMHLCERCLRFLSSLGVKVRRLGQVSAAGAQLCMQTQWMIKKVILLGEWSARNCSKSAEVTKMSGECKAL